MQKLTTIAVALGPERTRDELVPFVTESVDDEDEVILALAQQLGALIPLIGGADHATVLLPALESLAGVEEAAVRDAAVASLNAVISGLSEETARSAAWPLVERLGMRDWFTARTSACGVLPRVVQRLPLGGKGPTKEQGSTRPTGGSAGMDLDHETPSPVHADSDAAAAAAAAGGDGASSGSRSDAFALYSRLSNDETPMVRRAASLALHDMATALSGGSLSGGAPGPGGSGSKATAGGDRMEDEEEDGGSSGGDGKAAAAAAAAVAAAIKLADGYNVDTGDVSNSAVPPPVPPAVRVAVGSPAAGDAAARQLLPLLDVFSRDDQDSVRLLAMDNATAIAKLVPKGAAAAASAAGPTGAAGGEGGATAAFGATGVMESLLGVVSALAGDKSWRVRWSVANRFSEFAHAVALGPSAAAAAPVAGAGPVAPTSGGVPASRLLPLFERLLADGEAEVRTAAAYRVSDVATLVGTPATTAVILPLVSRLSDDSSEHVRAALASVILGLAPLLGREGTIGSLLPLLLRLLRDATPQVRLNVISRLEVVNSVIGLKMLSQSLVPAILELATDKQWRVRLAIIEFMPLLGSQLGAEFFDEQLTTLCVRWMSDSVHAIRQAAVTNLRKLAEVFGPSWAQRVIFPRITALHVGEANYLVRLTALQAIAAVASALRSAPQLQVQLLTVLLSYAVDPVPNIRFNLAKALERLAPALAPLSEGAAPDAAAPGPVVGDALIRPALVGLTADRDEDVRFYSRKALAAFPAAAPLA